MNALTITNTTELRSKIGTLRQLDAEQQAALAARFSSPGAIFSSLSSLLSKRETGEKTAIW